MKNLTIEVMSLVDCTELGDGGSVTETVWRQTLVGCRVLLMLQDLYMFNVNYVFDDLLYNTSAFTEAIGNSTTEIFVRPMALFSFMLDLFPVYPIFTWRYGFMVRGENTKLLGAYYSLPFDRTVWRCLIAMCLLVTLFFFLLSWLEDRLLGGKDRPSLSYEFLVAFGAYCQHVLPTEARLQSRNFAYFVFILFSYITYCFYSTNLLSHMVAKRDNTLTVADLREYQYPIVTMDTIMPILMMMLKYNLTLWGEPPTVMTDVEEAVISVKTTRVALLSDYDSIYPYMKRILTTEELCQINEIDLFTNIDKYLFTTKNFKYKEEFKIGTIRLRETGLLRRLLTIEHYQQSSARMCSDTQYSERTRLASLLMPLVMLAATCCLSLLMLAVERAQYQRERVFPFVN